MWGNRFGQRLGTVGSDSRGEWGEESEGSIQGGEWEQRGRILEVNGKRKIGNRSWLRSGLVGRILEVDWESKSGSLVDEK